MQRQSSVSFQRSQATLGGGGLGMVWGETTFDECVATVQAAVAAGINWIDLAPRYGDGKAELVVGEAFAGRLPQGVRVTSKCNLGNPSSADIEPLVRQSIEEASSVCGCRGSICLSTFECRPRRGPLGPPARGRRPHDALRDLCRPGASAVRAAGGRGSDRCLGADRDRSPGHDHQAARRVPAPSAVQCIANLLDLPGGPKFFDGPAKPRAVMAAARANGVGVMGIRAVQAGALTSALDRPLPDDHPRCAIMREPPASGGSPENWASLLPCWRIAMRCRSTSTPRARRQEPAGARRVRSRG